MDSFSEKYRDRGVHPLCEAKFQLRCRLAFVCVWLFSLCLATGCVSNSYQYGTGHSLSNSPLQPTSPAFSVAFGGAHPHLDRLEHFVKAPRRLLRKLAGRPAPDPVLQLARREQSLAMAQEYLSVNGIDDLYIDVRSYQPAEQWRRLKNNQEIRPIWKYTGGTGNWLRYTLLPMRAFGRDQYDPFTHTLNLNSDDLASTIYETAQTKEFLRDRQISRGSYAMIQYVPFLPLIHHANAGSDALTYSEHHLQGELTDELYPLTYSRIGSTAVSETLSVVSLSPGTPFYTAPLLRGTGGIIGYTVGANIPERRSTAGQAISPSFQSHSSEGYRTMTDQSMYYRAEK